jgi:outer membrane protein assembly factor BamB
VASPGAAAEAHARPSAGDRLRQGVLTASLLVVAAGFVSLAVMRRHGLSQGTPTAAPTTIYTAPPVAPVAPTPEGEIAWESNARAPVVATINADVVEDFFGFFRVWDGRSAWIAHFGAFDGATLKPLWKSEPIDPQLVKQAGVVPLAVVVGSRVVVADTSPTLRVFSLATGEKLSTLKLAGPVSDVCRSPEQPNRVWVAVVGGGDTTLDLATEKSDLAPRPRWCPAAPYQPTVTPPTLKHATPADLAALAKKTADLAACTDAFVNGTVALARCHAPEGPKDDRAFEARYELTDGTVTVAIGTKADHPFAVSRTKAATWEHGFVTDGSMAKPVAPAVADLAFGRVYAVYEKVYFDARVAALDGRTGQTLWEAPLVGSLPGSDGPGRGEARELVATPSRVYVARAGGGLDVFDASTGKPVGSIGKQ